MKEINDVIESVENGLSFVTVVTKIKIIYLNKSYNSSDHLPFYCSLSKYPSMGSPELYRFTYMNYSIIVCILVYVLVMIIVKTFLI